MTNHMVLFGTQELDTHRYSFSPQILKRVEMFGSDA
jgi:hypothetical protein